jgi:hypothetical protein
MGRTSVMQEMRTLTKFWLQNLKPLEGPGCRHEGSIKNERRKKLRGTLIKTNGAPAEHHATMSVRWAAGSQTNGVICCPC